MAGPKSYDSTETRVLYKLYITMLTCMSFLNVNTLNDNKKANKIQKDWSGNGKIYKNVDQSADGLRTLT